MKRFWIALLLLLVVFPAFAVRYEILDYTFNVTGKTRPESLSDIIGSKGSIFDNKDELVKFLEEKKQDLLNMRLFNDVEYQFTEDDTEVVVGVHGVHVSFYVWDASSIFVLPYPKYDSNYGFKLGIKAYNKNLAGSFSNLYGYLGFSQQDGSFKKGAFDWELSVDPIRLGSTTASVSHVGSIDLLDWNYSRLSFSTGVNDFSVGDVDVSLGAALTMTPDGASYDSPWGLSSASTSFNLRFNNSKLDNLALYNSLKYLFRTKETDINTRLTHNIQFGIYSQTVLNTIQIDKPDDVNKGIDFIELGTGIGRSFKPFKTLSFTTSFMFYAQYDYELEIVVPYFDLALTSSRSDIDWIGNFRKGYSYEARTDLLSYPISEEDRNSFRFWGTFSGFYPVTSWFNPSARLSMTLSGRNQYFEFSSAAEIADYARGVRLDNPLVDTDIIAMRKVAVAFNLDLMMNFITIKDFCKSYVVPFMDVLYVSNENPAKDYHDVIMTVGGEGIVILDSHPSYPIRGSLGINANDLYRFSKGEIGLRDIEFEIFIGMGFYY